MDRWAHIAKVSSVMYPTLIIGIILFAADPWNWRTWVIFLSGPTAAMLLLAVWPKRWE